MNEENCKPINQNECNFIKLNSFENEKKERNHNSNNLIYKNNKQQLSISKYCSSNIFKASQKWMNTRKKRNSVKRNNKRGNPSVKW